MGLLQLFPNYYRRLLDLDLGTFLIHFNTQYIAIALKNEDVLIFKCMHVYQYDLIF